jgi:hypothetical protein
MTPLTCPASLSLSQALAERFETPKNQADDRSLSPPHLLGDVGHGEALKVLQFQGASLVRRQLRKRLRKAQQSLLPQNLLAGRRLIRL